MDTLSASTAITTGCLARVVTRRRSGPAVPVALAAARRKQSRSRTRGSSVIVNTSLDSLQQLLTMQPMAFTSAKCFFVLRPALKFLSRTRRACSRCPHSFRHALIYCVLVMPVSLEGDLCERGFSRSGFAISGGSCDCGSHLSSKSSMDLQNRLEQCSDACMHKVGTSFVRPPSGVHRPVKQSKSAPGRPAKHARIDERTASEDFNNMGEDAPGRTAECNLPVQTVPLA